MTTWEWNYTEYMVFPHVNIRIMELDGIIVSPIVIHCGDRWATDECCLSLFWLVVKPKLEESTSTWPRVGSNKPPTKVGSLNNL